MNIKPALIVALLLCIIITTPVYAYEAAHGLPLNNYTESSSRIYGLIFSLNHDINATEVRFSTNLTGLVNVCNFEERVSPYNYYSSYNISGNTAYFNPPLSLSTAYNYSITCEMISQPGLVMWGDFTPVSGDYINFDHGFDNGLSNTIFGTVESIVFDAELLPPPHSTWDAPNVYYSFDNTTINDTTVQDQANNYDGIFVFESGASAQINQEGYVADGVHFNYTDSASVGWGLYADGYVSNDSNGWTISSWIKLDADAKAGAQQNFFTDYPDSIIAGDQLFYDDYVVWLCSDDVSCTEYLQIIWNTTAAGWVEGEWAHIVTVYDPTAGNFSDIKLYVDGVLQTPTSTMGALSAAPVVDRSLNPWGMAWTGTSFNDAPAAFIDEVIFYDGVLDESNVSALYDSYFPPEAYIDITMTAPLSPVTALDFYSVNDVFSAIINASYAPLYRAQLNAGLDNNYFVANNIEFSFSNYNIFSWFNDVYGYFNIPGYTNYTATIKVCGMNETYADLFCAEENYTYTIFNAPANLTIASLTVEENNAPYNLTYTYDYTIDGGQAWICTIKCDNTTTIATDAIDFYTTPSIQTNTMTVCLSVGNHTIDIIECHSETYDTNLTGIASVSYTVEEPPIPPPEPGAFSWLGVIIIIFAVLFLIYRLTTIERFDLSAIIQILIALLLLALVGIGFI